MSEDKPSKHKRGKARRVIVPLIGSLVLLGAGMGAGIALAQLGWIASMGAVRAASRAAVAEEPPRYFTMEQGFTSNLKGSESFVQLSLALSTRGGETALAAIKANEPALRSAALQVLAQQSYESVSTLDGRRALQAALRRALDDELRTRIGNGGIDNVYFTAFVLQ